MFVLEALHGIAPMKFVLEASKQLTSDQTGYGHFKPLYKCLRKEMSTDSAIIYEYPFTTYSQFSSLQ